MEPTLTGLEPIVALIPQIAGASVDAAKELLTLVKEFPINITVALALGGWAFNKVRGMMGK